MVLVSLKTEAHCKKLIHSRKYDNSSNTFRCNSAIISNTQKFRFNFGLHFFLANSLYFRKPSRLPCIFGHLLSPPRQPSHLLPEPQQDPSEKYYIFVNTLELCNSQVLLPFDLKLPLFSDSYLSTQNKQNFG